MSTEFSRIISVVTLSAPDAEEKVLRVRFLLRRHCRVQVGNTSRFRSSVMALVQSITFGSGNAVFSAGMHIIQGTEP